MNRVKGQGFRGAISEDFSLTIHIEFPSSKFNVCYDSTPIVPLSLLQLPEVFLLWILNGYIYKLPSINYVV